MKSLERLRAYARTFTGTTKHEIENFADDVACEVERDYVSRDTHSKAAEILQAACDEWRKRATEAEAERDEWKAKCERQAEAIGEWELRCERLESECDKLKRKAKEEELNANGHWRNANNWAKQVDEWKAKAEAKSAKRAAAVERLRNFESSDVGDGYYWDVTWSLLGKRPTEYDSSVELLSALIDLLTDEPMDAESDNNGTCPNDNGTCPDDADSREKLEADIDAIVLCIENEAKQYAPSLNGYGTREKLDDLVRGLKARMLEVADRQAAITERECREEYKRLCDGKNGGWSAKCFELGAKCAELQAMNANIADQLLESQDTVLVLQNYERAAMRLQAEKQTLTDLLDEYKARNEELQAKIDELQAKLAEYESKSEICTILSGGKIYTGSKALTERIAELQEQVNGLTAELEARDKYPDGFIPHVEMMEQVGELTTERDYWKRQYELISRAVEDVARNYCDEGMA